MIAGLEEITAGEIYIGDRKVNDVAPKDRDIAMVFQSYALYPHMNVFENMAFGLKLRGMSKADIKERVHEAARILDIEHLLERKPKALSGGQRQRVALGRAIVREPQVFLMDEPLSNLDAKLRVQMRAEISKLCQRLKTTVIYVTHDQTEAMTMGDRIVVMKDGYIQQVDSPMNLYNHPANMFVAGFIGSPSMNFIKVRVESRGDKIHLTNSGINIALGPEEQKDLASYINKEIILGVRPEHVYEEQSFLESHPDWIANIIVDVTEPMGSETYVYFSLGGQNVTARLGASTTARVGERYRVALDMNQAHYFDMETEKAIG
jgi:multiple sugar transport system ATP-binding protein